MNKTLTFDFRQTIAKNRLKGLWRMMVDYRWPYIGATVALAISALSKTLTYLLLRYFADVLTGDAVALNNDIPRTFALVALGFVGLSVFQGGFSFISGRLTHTVAFMLDVVRNGAY